MTDERMIDPLARPSLTWVCKVSDNRMLVGIWLYAYNRSVKLI